MRLQDFIRQMPRVKLHLHLEGSVDWSMSIYTENWTSLG